MNLARVTGNIVCTRKESSLVGEKLLLLQPVEIVGQKLADKGRELVAADTVRAGPGDIVIYETGREAALSLEKTFNTVDAAILAIIDEFTVDEGKR